MKKTRIAYISEASADDKHSWSGTVHYVYKALLDSGFELKVLGPARPGLLRYLLAALNKLSLLLFKKRLDYRHSKSYAKAFGRIFNQKLQNTEHDAIVVCGTTECGAYLKTTKPVFYVLDRTIEGALNYHTILSDLWDSSKKQSVFTDRKAMTESTLLFFSSRWAAEHARKSYNIPESKIRVLPFGANLDRIPDRETALRRKNTEHWKLLLIGTYWKNKGADIAFNALLGLLKHNVSASLTVVGCTPPENIHHERLTIIPFVDKNSESGINTLWELFLSHHFFILPTRFDCTPIVFCEASAFGMPILSANTGGVEGHIKEGVNGFLIPYEDRGEGYAKKLMELITDPERYHQLCYSTRLHFEEHLNWEKWGQEFKKEIAAFL